MWTDELNASCSEWRTNGFCRFCFRAEEQRNKQLVLFRSRNFSKLKVLLGSTWTFLSKSTWRVLLQLIGYCSWSGLYFNHVGNQPWSYQESSEIELWFTNLRRWDRWRWEDPSLCRPSQWAAAGWQMWTPGQWAGRSQRCASVSGWGSVRLRRSWCPDQECTWCRCVES